MYYGLILIAVTMFGGGFALQDLYRKKRGNSLKTGMEAACIGSLAGLIVLLIINGFSFEYTPFTLQMAAWAALNDIMFTFCAFKALEHINLSLFSLFTMLGGMILPFLQGIVFYGEDFTVAKGICVSFILTSLLCTVRRDQNRNCAIYCAGVFVLNGMAGVISKIFTESNFPKASASGYSVWITIAAAVLSGGAWLTLSLIEKKNSNKNAKLSSQSERTMFFRSYGVGALYGIVNKMANFLLVIALANVDASVQYPMVTGGTIIVSTALSFWDVKKPTSREMFSVGLAFVGILSLFLISA